MSKKETIFIQAQKVFLFLLVLLLPTQLGVHFWPDFAYFFGIRVDYFSPTVYLTDVLLFFLLASWFFSGDWRSSSVPFPLIIFLFYLLATSFFVAENQGAAFYKLVKLGEFSVLALYVFLNKGFFSLSWFRFALFGATAYSSLIAILQFIKQGSLGGFFWWLGERSFAASTPAIALANFAGQEFLRPYSIFSHPNSMSGFLLLSLVLLWPPKTSWQGAVFAVAVIAILLSFSQAVWLALAVILGVHAFRRKIRTRSLTAAITIFIILAGLVPFLLGPISGQREGFNRRIELAGAAGRMVADSPFFGVGLNNFIARLPEFSRAPAVSWWLQPVHNIFLLFFSETGMVGMVFLLYFGAGAAARAFMNPTGSRIIFLFLTIAITGSLDHYWLTLQQNQLLLAVTLGLLYPSRS